MPGAASCLCDDQCAAVGDTQCATATSEQVCQLTAADCLQWGAATTCPGGEDCTGTACACPAPAAGVLYVSNTEGSDVAGNGSSACPFQTITTALAKAGAQAPTAVQVIVESTGTNYAAPTETFPLTLPSNATLNGTNAAGTVIAAGSGSAADAVTISGSGAVGGTAVSATLVANGGSVVGVVLLTSPTQQQTQNVDIVVCSLGSPSIDSSQIGQQGGGGAGGQYGVLITGTCSAVLSNDLIEGNASAGFGGGGGAGVRVENTATATVQFDTVTGNRTGIDVESTNAKGTVITGVTINNNTNDGVDCDTGAGAIGGGGASTLSISATTLSQNRAGLDVGGACSATLSGDTVSANARDGVDCDVVGGGGGGGGAASLTMAATTVSGNGTSATARAGYAGVNVGGACMASLAGSATAACDPALANTFVCNSATNGFDVESTSSVAVDASFDDWGTAPPRTEGTVTTASTCSTTAVCP